MTSLPSPTARCKSNPQSLFSGVHVGIVDPSDKHLLTRSFAGSDSTASTMQSFFWHVLADPAVHKRVVAEVRTAVDDGRVPAEGNLSWAQAQDLPFFQACLKEGMRVRPAVGLNITRLVPPEGAELDGHFFEAGTRIAVNGWVLHRDRAVFGDDSEAFRPARWLEDEERARRMERYMFQVRFYRSLPPLVLRRMRTATNFCV